MTEEEKWCVYKIDDSNQELMDTFSNRSDAESRAMELRDEYEGGGELFQVVDESAPTKSKANKPVKASARRNGLLKGRK